jgi:hypothetical protein
MIALHRRWLEEAGARFTGNHPVEINPLWAASADEVKQRLPTNFTISEPTYFAPTGPQVFA